MKTDPLHKILKFIDYNRYKVMGILLSILIVGFVGGCPIKAPGLSPEGDSVTTDQFQLEIITENQKMQKRVVDYESEGLVLQLDIDVLNSRIELTEKSFTEQFEFRQKMISFSTGLAGTLISGGTIDIGKTILSAVTLAALVGGGGAIADNRRANRVITDLKKSSQSV